MRSRWILLTLIVSLSGCQYAIGIEPVDDRRAAFPSMTPEQVSATRQCRAEHPAIDEWWVRYVKAWCKAEGDGCD